MNLNKSVNEIKKLIWVVFLIINNISCADFKEIMNFEDKCKKLDEVVEYLINNSVHNEIAEAVQLKIGTSKLLDENDKKIIGTIINEFKAKLGQDFKAKLKDEEQSINELLELFKNAQNCKKPNLMSLLSGATAESMNKLIKYIHTEILFRAATTYTGRLS